MAISIPVLLHQTSVQRMYEQILFELIPLLTLLQSGKAEKQLNLHSVAKSYISVLHSGTVASSAAAFFLRLSCQKVLENIPG